MHLLMVSYLLLAQCLHRMAAPAAETAVENAYRFCKVGPQSYPVLVETRE